MKKIVLHFLVGYKGMGRKGCLLKSSMASQVLIDIHRNQWSKSGRERGEEMGKK